MLFASLRSSFLAEGRHLAHELTVLLLESLHGGAYVNDLLLMNFIEFFKLLFFNARPDFIGLPLHLTSSHPASNISFNDQLVDIKLDFFILLPARGLVNKGVLFLLPQLVS